MKLTSLIQNSIEPRYEFGYGLSYTTFRLSNLKITSTKSKEPFPSPRPTTLPPPRIDESIPSPKEALFKGGFKKLHHYIYPYINRESDIKKGSYPYPDGYTNKQPLSEAGGGEGGNPSLWDVFAEVEVKLKNTGKKTGKEVVQLYIGFPDKVPVPGGKEGEYVDFPIKQLRAFEKVEAHPGGEKATVTVKMKLTRKDLSFWDVQAQNWRMPTEGSFKIMVGNSSRNLKLVGEL
jgi:Fibronectin type III-like domain